MEYISDSYVILAILVFASFCAGFIDSIAGGGGFILVPALMLAGLPPQAAIATNKVPAVFGTATAAYNFIRSKKVIWPIAIIGLIFALLGGAVGSKLNQGISADVLNKIVLMILPIAAIVTFIPKKNMKQNVSSFSKKELYIAAPFITFILGIYDGFIGPGMGFSCCKNSKFCFRAWLFSNVFKSRSCYYGNRAAITCSKCIWQLYWK